MGKDNGGRSVHGETLVLGKDRTTREGSGDLGHSQKSVEKQDEELKVESEDVSLKEQALQMKKKTLHVRELHHA